MLRFPRLLFHSSDVPQDGFGQSLADDLRSYHRFRRIRLETLMWRKPTDEEARMADAHPIVGRFGDATYAVRNDGERRFIVRDRMWHGWPDPPEFALFILDRDVI